MSMHKLTNEELDQLPMVQFSGTIKVIETPEALAEAVDQMRNETLLGFDTETRPSFKRGVNHKVALLQLSTEKMSWLVRLNKVAISDELLEILAGNSVMKVGVAIRDDIKGLQKWRKFIPQNFVDLQDMARKRDFEDFSLKKLAAHVMGVRISKRQRLSNWEAETLTVAQQLYASTDSWVSLMIYKGMEQGIVEHERIRQIIKSE